MIVYFSDRKLNILGHASTELPGGLGITDDWMGGDVETGVALFEFKIPFDNDTREDVEAFTAVGNYVLRSHDGENGFFTIIDTETDTKKQTVYVYAEDAGMDLLNDVFGKYEADKAYPISNYIEMFASGSGFVIGKNEASSLTRKLTFDNEATASARIASVAAQFDGCEVSYSFDIDGLLVTRKYINIHKKRGQDIGAQLRLNYDIDSIITSKSIGNLATALRCTGGTIDQESNILEATGGGVSYKLDLDTEGRTKNTATINATIAAALTSESAELGEAYGLKASIYMGGAWHSVVIKATTEADKENWKGTVNHTTEFTFTVSGVPAGVATYTDIKLKVERTDSKGGSAGILAATNCAAYSIPNYVTGGENGEEISTRDITIEGYVYDDGDFYVDGPLLKSREALKNWSRYLWKTDDTHESGGHIVKTYSYDTDSQKTLCEKTIAELKKAREIEVNYKVEITKLPPNIRLGDRVNIVDDAGGLYISARLLKFEVSAANQEHKATIGEYLVKGSGIADKVAALAQKFAKLSASASRALAIAKNAKSAANTAKSSAAVAASGAKVAQEAAEAAKTAADAASASALAAQEKADAAQSAVDVVEESVASLETTVANAQAAAEQAQKAAETAETKANEAHTSAVNAQAKAEEAKTAAENAQTKSDSAISTAESAETAADEAMKKAEAASTTAAAAKLDAENAQKEIDTLGENLTTLSNTMSADYARKTDLTEATASLQTQITQNAAEISSTASKVQEIDETANNAQEQAEAAQTAASAAQATADQAAAEASAAQSAADTASAAAQAAQSEADTAKAAAETAQSVADKANADLKAAKEDLATVTSRVDATEEDIASAQEAVKAAQSAADKANADAKTATEKATAAQSTADTAVTNAADAQTAANNAASAAALAQKTAGEAKGDASAAQAAADEAAETAAEAQRTANTAKTNAENAQTKANEAAEAAASAQAAADDADAKAAQAAADLATAQQNLANVTSRVDATEAEVEAAQAAVETAQAAADKAKTDAAAAQSTADKAKADAATAQTAADNAKTAADNAQAAADDAKNAADKAQDDVDALAVRVTTAETKITQNSDKIALMATKTEVAQTLGGYYTKSETDAAITVKADEITQTVSRTYATKEEFNELEIGGRNLLRWTQRLPVVADAISPNGISLFDVDAGTLEQTENGAKLIFSSDSQTGMTIPLAFDGCVASRETVTLSFDYRGNITSPGKMYYLQRTKPNVSFDLSTISALVANETEWQHFEVTFACNSANDRVNYQILLFYNLDAYTADNWIEIKAGSLQLERGNKATDWTPAPEDVDADIAAGDNALRETIDAQSTSILQDAENIILSALESYTKTGDFEAYKETVSTQLEIMAGEITMNFTTTTEQINTVDGDVQSKFTELYNYIKFSGGGITINESTGLRLALAGGKIALYNSDMQLGLWEGSDFYCGNIVVQVNERAQFGNFAWIPRSDGSLMFLKVGG